MNGSATGPFALIPMVTSSYGDNAISMKYGESKSTCVLPTHLELSEHLIERNVKCLVSGRRSFSPFKSQPLYLVVVISMVNGTKQEHSASPCTSATQVCACACLCV